MSLNKYITNRKHVVADHCLFHFTSWLLKELLIAQKNKPGHNTILYLKNSNEKCFIGFKAHARDVLSVS